MDRLSSFVLYTPTLTIPDYESVVKARVGRPHGLDADRPEALLVGNK